MQSKYEWGRSVTVIAHYRYALQCATLTLGTGLCNLVSAVQPPLSPASETTPHTASGAQVIGPREFGIPLTWILNVCCEIYILTRTSIQSSVYGLRTHITYVRGGVSSFVDLWARNWGWPLAHCDFMHGACVRNEEKMLGILIDCLIIRNRPSPSQVCGSVVILIYY